MHLAKSQTVSGQPVVYRAAREDFGAACDESQQTSLRTLSVVIPEHRQKVATMMSLSEAEIRTPGCGADQSLQPSRPTIMLPGAWAMGDGLILEADEDLPWSYDEAPDTEDLESLGTSIARAAGSFSASVRGYLQDLASALTSSDANVTSPTACTQPMDAEGITGEFSCYKTQETRKHCRYTRGAVRGLKPHA
ncbi:hypothetical protein Agub_g15187 [Astrephomene gubernaculifera]|uniref:Uncharacterized protein n=1 Tax=Astrephomene gubernaculifera TaxID=47775 RepID=A0AAD3E4C0_9CHLO|nr:hypothetical protein Agub_g15187 [Astrephomene gubernaculifera]